MTNRRDFLKEALLTGAAAMAAPIITKGENITTQHRTVATHTNEGVGGGLIVPKNNGLPITGTFLDEISHDIPHQNWGEKEWDQDFQYMKAIGIDTYKHDVRFVEDDWESPSLGAWGLGWEVWLNGMEVTQFTYFQQVGSIDVKPVTVEITYGLERLAMYIQGVENVFDIQWVGDITYGDVFHTNEVEQSFYNFQVADTALLFDLFDKYEAEAKRVIELGYIRPAYDYVLKCSYAFNLLDSRRAISVSERTAYIGRVRAMARLCAKAYVAQREEMGFPLLKKGENK